MKMVLVMSLAATLGAAPGPESAPQAPLAEPSAASKARLEAAAARLHETSLSRRLLAETMELPRREGDLAAGEDGVLFLRRQPPVLAVGPRRLKELSDPELDLALVREIARAAADLPFPVPEGDMAAYQAELDYAMERCGQDAVFSSALRRAYAGVQRQEESLLAEHGRVRGFLPAGESLAPPLLPLPRREFERLAYLVLVFARDPDEFYHVVERAAAREPGAVRFTELQDFMERYGPDFSAVRLGPRRRYARAGGRRYPTAVFDAARQLAESGGLARIREALGPFETLGRDTLTVKVNAWVRGGP